MFPVVLSKTAINANVVFLDRPRELSLVKASRSHINSQVENHMQQSFVINQHKTPILPLP